MHGIALRTGGESVLRLVNDVPSGEIIVSDRHALLTILRNLLRNAAEYAGPAILSYGALKRFANHRRWTGDRTG